MNFLGLNLSDIPVENLTNWTVYVIPILYVLTSFVSMKLASNANKNGKNDNKEDTTIKATKEDKALIKKDDKKEEDEMSEMNRSMDLMMTVMSVSISMIAPLGLALYWFISNLISIIERLITNKFFKEAEEE
jgi:membrane protein insertase Oxa1/YidC/SpoIIIJ